MKKVARNANTSRIIKSARLLIWCVFVVFSLSEVESAPEMFPLQLAYNASFQSALDTRTESAADFEEILAKSKSEVPPLPPSEPPKLPSIPSVPNRKKPASTLPSSLPAAMPNGATVFPSGNPGPMNAGRQLSPAVASNPGSVPQAVIADSSWGHPIEPAVPPDEFLSRMKDIQNEINRTVADFNKKKKEFQTSRQAQLDGFGNSDEEKVAKSKYMDESQKVWMTMLSDYKAKIDLLKGREEELRASRYKKSSGNKISTVGNSRTSRSQELKYMQDLSNRKKQQDSLLQQDKVHQDLNSLKSAQEKARILSQPNPTPASDTVIAPSTTTTPAPTYTNPFKTKQY